MMMNLFSMFDPSASFIMTPWIILVVIPTLYGIKMWMMNSPLLLILLQIIKSMKNEVSFTLKKTEKGTEIMIIVTFLSIILMNFTALYPQIFSVTSHLTITLPLSLIFWLSLMIFGWLKNTNHMMSHLLPQGTPMALMMFMVLIELTSNMIRPITLCVRLTANLIAGHLLMSLLGNFLLKMTILINMPALAIPILLTILETAVACIQAYVFMTLITLYTTETK